MLDLDSWVDEFHAGNEQKAVNQDTCNAAAGSSPSPLSVDVITLAYRLRTPCCVRHTLPSDCPVGCVASPWCLAGLSTLSTNNTTLQDFVADLLGDDTSLASSHQPQLQRGEHGPNDGDSPAGTSSVDVYKYPIRRGIRDLGNTCYLNAVLQMLFHIPAVRDEVLRASASFPVAAHNSAKKITPLLASGLGELFAEMAYSRDERGVDAERFASFLSIDKGIQQDAQEFFVLLINWLQREVGDAVRHVFEGTILHDRECSKCGRSCKRAEPFSFLSLPVRQSIEESLEELLRVHEVQGFKCEECGAVTSAFSRLHIRTLPDVLVVHFNRFSFSLQEKRREKITRSVSFPIEWDLTPYKDRWRQVQKQTASNNSGVADSVVETRSNGAQLYRLVGVVNHHGEAAVCGHYTYHGKMDGHGGWYQFDNAVVTRLQRFHGTRASSKEAYMLVYERHAHPTNNPLTSAEEDVERAGALDTTIILPPHLQNHIERLNHEVEKVRQARQLQRSVVMNFMKQWKDVADDIFYRSARRKGHPIAVMEECEDLTQYVAFPTRWMKLFGRCFIPSYIDTNRYCSFERGMKRHRRNSSKSAVELSNELPAAGSDSKEVEDNAPPVAAEMVLDTTKGAMPGDCVLIKSIYKSTLTDYLEDVRCPHGKLAPWGQYKLLSGASARRLNSFLNSVPSLLTSLTTVGEFTPFKGWKLSEYICEECVKRMSKEVQRIKTSWNEDMEIQTAVTPTSKFAEREDADELVYVSVEAVEHWEQMLKVTEKYRYIVKQQGFTGLVVAMKARSEDVDTEVIPLPSPSKLLCEHQLLSSVAAVREVPASVWHLLKKRILQLFYGDSVSVKHTLTPSVKAHMEMLLPYLPVSHTGKCLECIQNKMRMMMERHSAKMEKLNEGKRFSTLLEASRVMALPSVEVRIRHPNTLVWKRDIKRSYRRCYRTWEREQEDKITAVEARIKSLKEVGGQREKKQRTLPTPPVRCDRKQSQEPSDSQQVCEVTCENSQSIPDVMEVPSPLQSACDELAALRAATPPDVSAVYGCIPAWWVARWYKWYTNDADTGVGPPPCVDYSAFFCQHGGTVLPPSSLNPTDAHWSKTFTLGPIIRAWKSWLKDPSALDVVEESGSVHFPPIVLVPLKEMIAVLERYGGEGQLLPEVTDSNDLVTRLNNGRVVLFVERRGERMLDPPTCKICSTAVLDGVTELSRGFIDGSLRLRLHLRRSKRQHYDANDVLSGVSYNMTVGKLKVEISQRVLEYHGYILPVNDMKLLLGRKPLGPNKICKENTCANSNGNAPDGAASPSVASDDRNEGSATGALSTVDVDTCTLFECGLRDGDEVTVDASNTPLEKVLVNDSLSIRVPGAPTSCSETPTAEDVAAFGATRLYGVLDNVQNGRERKAPGQKACAVCTYLNVREAERCEMCEAAL